MQFDDRLATVLRTRAGGQASARTQFRQLIDLLGTLPSAAQGKDVDAAWDRLAELSKELPAKERAEALAESGLRLRSPELVAQLARSEPAVADAALLCAQLNEGQWLDLIPALPVAVRPQLRQRDDLGANVEGLLDRLGIARHGLPPAGRASRHPANDTAGEILPEASEGIGAIVQRIEAYRKRKLETPPQPQAPPAAREPLQSVAFSCDERGLVNWSEPAAASALSGLRLISRDETSPATCSVKLFDAFRRRVPLHGEGLTIAGAPSVAGAWRVDAFPRFDALGRFSGYEGRLRRPCPPELAPQTAQHGEADRLRQLLHELRTPVNAIQGFAEVIQQQLFGPTPHEYRAHAAAIAGDAARMLAGFDDLERLAKLTTGAMDLDPGQCDLSEVTRTFVQQLEAHTAARNCGFSLIGQGETLAVEMTCEDTERLIWRLLATLASATAPGERLALELSKRDGAAMLTVNLPKALADQADIFHASASPLATPLSAGMFGAGFALRLAASEARAAGGKLERKDASLRLELPLAANGLTGPENTENKGMTG